MSPPKQRLRSAPFLARFNTSGQDSNAKALGTGRSPGIPKTQILERINLERINKDGLNPPLLADNLSELTVALLGNSERNFPSRSSPQHAERSEFMERNRAVHGHLRPYRPTMGTGGQAAGISAVAVCGAGVSPGAPAPLHNPIGYRSGTANAHDASNAGVQPRTNAQEYEAFVHAPHSRRLLA